MKNPFKAKAKANAGALPRSLRYRNHSYALVMRREIPFRPASAIYAGPLVLQHGKLRREYLILRADHGLVGQADNLTAAIKSLLDCQSQRVRKPRAAPLDLSQGVLAEPAVAS